MNNKIWHSIAYLWFYYYDGSCYIHAQATIVYIHMHVHI